MSSPPLTALNYLNVVAYVANVVITYGVGVLGIAGTATNAELSEKYQTLVTPAGITFAIWGIIFVAQLIFTIVQLLPAFRGSKMVASAIGYDYIAVCIAQIGWTLSFTFEIIWLSLAFMLGILYFLLTLINDQYKEEASDSPVRDYWLLKFPFSIHTGWIIAASCVNINVLLVDLSVSSDVQYYVAIGTLVLLVFVSSFSVSFPARPEYVIPLVLAWASFGIFSELGDPKQLILATFADERVEWIRRGAILAMTLILVGVLLKVVLNCVKNKNAPAETNSDESRYSRMEDGRTRASGKSRATTRTSTDAPSMMSGLSNNS